MGRLSRSSWLRAPHGQRHLVCTDRPPGCGDHSGHPLALVHDAGGGLRDEGGACLDGSLFEPLQEGGSVDGVLTGYVEDFQRPGDRLGVHPVEVGGLDVLEGLVVAGELGTDGVVVGVVDLGRADGVEDDGGAVGGLEGAPSVLASSSASHCGHSLVAWMPSSSLARPCSVASSEVVTSAKQPSMAPAAADPAQGRCGWPSTATRCPRCARTQASDNPRTPLPMMTTSKPVPSAFPLALMAFQSSGAGPVALL